MILLSKSYQLYTIVDIETTGNGIKGNKITEISIFKYDGDTVVDEFTSLVNPQCDIPYFITGLTGIDSYMVQNAPTIDEIAPKIEAITAGSIFVAHSVNFDYNVIKNEFKDLGREFVRKKLCTVRLSRRLFPGYHSYSLGKLCSALEIPLTDRHRARGDAMATTLLFQKLINVDGATAVFKTFLNARSQEATLPPALSRSVLQKIPEAPGVYYFKNKKGEVIYVGKAINLKKRVLGHFYDKATKEVQLCNETADITYELSGSEIVALLMESAEIKHRFPKYNRAQKRTIQRYGIFSYLDRRGIRHLAFNKLKLIAQPLISCANTTEARLYLGQLCETYGLCPKYCHLQENVKHCNHYKIKCDGICREKEAIEVYNEKVAHAIEEISSDHKDYIIKEKGRNTEEDALILIREGTYYGYGFIPKETKLNSTADVLAFVTPQKNTSETQSLIRSYLLKHPEGVLSLELNEFS